MAKEEFVRTKPHVNIGTIIIFLLLIYYVKLMLFNAKYGNATICGCKITSILSNYQVFLQLFTLKCSFYGFCSIFKPYFLLFIKERRQFFIS
jgi:hypothetical protein